MREAYDYDNVVIVEYMMCRKKKKEEKLIDRKNIKYGSAGGDDKTE